MPWRARRRPRRRPEGPAPTIIICEREGVVRSLDLFSFFSLSLLFTGYGVERLWDIEGVEGGIVLRCQMLALSLWIGWSRCEDELQR